MLETVISNCEKSYLLRCLENNSRLDGRAFNECRGLNIKFGRDWGCCHVSLGTTRVIAQVSCEVQQPNTNRPGEGLLNVNIELNPLAAPHFEAGRQSEQSVQLNRLLEKCIKDSKAIDLESLCIKSKEKVWAVRVDVNVLNHEGNILDCASVAVLAALAHFRRPDFTIDGEEITIHRYDQRDPIPTVVHHYPVCVSYAIFNQGDVIIADPTVLEEGVSEGQLFFGLNNYKELCGLHLGGSSFMTPDLIMQTASKAARRANTVIQHIKKVLEDDALERQEKKEIGFHTSLNSSENALTVSQDELISCLDKWSTVETSKIKTKASKSKQKQRSKKIQGTIDNWGQNSGTLITPKDTSSIGEGTGNAWEMSSDEESNEKEEKMDVMEAPPEEKGKVTIILSSGEESEEDEVVIVRSESSNQKQNKRKKKTQK